MIIHAHHSSSPVAGDTKRVININKNVASFLSDKIVEIEYVPFRSLLKVLRGAKFKLSKNVVKKYYVLSVEHAGVLNDIWLYIILKLIFWKYTPTYYIEEWYLPRFINSICGFKVIKILDMHGATPEEYEYVNDSSCQRLEIQEQKSVNDANFIICQSDEMKRHIVAKYSMDMDKIVVFRCGVDTSAFKYKDDDRKSVRRELLIDDNSIIFVYSGGMHKWQKIVETLRLFKKYNDLDCYSKMLVLTRDKEALIKIIKENALDSIMNNLIIKSVAFHDVSKYLCAADVAFLLRDNVVMNAVASPTKLAEYMACGLPVLSTDVASKWVSGLGLGYIINIETLHVENIREILTDINRNDVADYASSNLSIDWDCGNIHSFFSSLIS
ncbi:MAG: hypothetical protein RR202_06005 [Bacteroidales bacterium]